MSGSAQAASIRPTASKGADSHRNDLDWLRSGLFLGLILYHVGLLYAPFSPYFVKSDHSHPMVEIVLLASHPWRMALLFLISGAATRVHGRQADSGEACAGRSTQLLPPLVLGFLLLIPIQSYLNLVHEDRLRRVVPELPEGLLLLARPRAGLSGPPHPPARLRPPPWFVLYLWGYTALLCGLLAFGRRWMRIGGDVLERVLVGPGW